MKTLKKVSLIVILNIIVILLAFVLLTQNGNTASALENKKEPIAETKYIINGETADGEIYVERGTFITIAVIYDGERFIPELFTDTDSFAYEIIDNEFGISSDSRIGGELLLYAFIIKDGIEITLEPITVVPVWESNFGEKIIKNSDANSFSITFADDNILSVKTSISMQNSGKTAKLLTNGDSIDDVINVAKHGYAGLTFEFDEITVNTVDNLGNVSSQTVTNGSDNMQISAYTSSSLSGNGSILFPYKIYSSEDLDLIPSYDDAYVYFKQMNSIDIYGGTIFQNSDFYGIYNGNSKYIYASANGGNSSIFCSYNYGTIRDFTLSVTNSITLSGTYTGLVSVKNYGTIRSVTVTTTSYSYPTSNFYDYISGNYAPIRTGTSLNFGGIAGANYGIIHTCSVDIETCSNFFAGGIAGLNLEGASIYSCNASLSLLGGYLYSLSLIGAILGKNNSGGSLYNNEGRRLLVYFSITSSNTSVPYVGGVCGANYSNSSIVYGNTRNSSYAFNVEGYPILLTSAQLVNIHNVYGYGAV